MINYEKTEDMGGIFIIMIRFVKVSQVASLELSYLRSNEKK